MVNARTARRGHGVLFLHAYFFFSEGCLLSEIPFVVSGLVSEVHGLCGLGYRAYVRWRRGPLRDLHHGAAQGPLRGGRGPVAVRGSQRH